MGKYELGSARQFDQGYVILLAWLCDTAAQLCYDIQSEDYLHMLGMYSVEPGMFVCSNFAEYVYV
jgi:hypothetical protein